MNELKRFRARWFPLALAWALAACGGGGGVGGSASAPTPEEQIAQLDANGALPILDRTDSIAGNDANANGVRDDIEQYLEKKYAVPEQRAAAMRTARVYQQMLLVDESDMVALDAVSEAGSLAIICAKSAFLSTEGLIERSRMSAELESITANTKARLLEYLAYNKARSGTVSTMPKGGRCD